MIILDNAALSLLKANIEENMEYYRHYSEPWIQKFIEGLNEDSLIQDDTLVLSNNPEYDTENAIRLYSKLRTLSTTLVSSNNYWTTLAHTSFYQYMQVRWPVNEDTKPRFVDTRYFFSATNQKSRARHGLTRLWWIAHLTYDEKNEADPFYYTKLATKDQELYNLIMETKHVAQNKKALFAMLDTFTDIFELVEEGKIEKFNKRDFFRDTMQQINLIGSVTIWDMLSREEAKDKLLEFVIKYFDLKQKSHLLIYS